MRGVSFVALLVVALGITACDTAQLEPSGTDYGAVLSLGNSLSAGFMNNGLRYEGQVAGFSNLVAKSVFNKSGLEPFMVMPLVRGAPQGGMGVSSTPGPNGELQGTLYVSPQGITQDAYPAGTSARDLLLSLLATAPYENLGVPGATTKDLLDATSSSTSQIPGNVFFDAVLRNEVLYGPLNPGERWKTIMEQAQEVAESPYNQRKELLMFWIGGNDVLGGTLGGNPVVGVNVTPAGVYEAMLTALTPQLKAAAYPQTVMLNIPDVTSLPYVTTIPAQITIPSGPTIAWTTDEDDVQFVLLPAQPLLFTPQGLPNPDYLPGGDKSLPGNLTLTAAEVAAVRAEIAGYNAAIAAAAEANGWALGDVNQALGDLPANPAEPNKLFPFLPSVLPPPGQNVNSAFSLDGVHPSEKGYGLIANVVVDALNETYGTNYFSHDISKIKNIQGFELLQQLDGTQSVTETSQVPMFTVHGAAALAGLAEFLGGQ